MKVLKGFFIFLVSAWLCIHSNCFAQTVSPEKMKAIYEEVKTPFKYGIVLTAPDSTKMADSPTVFRLKGKWYMTYIIFDGRGYETWLAESDDLLHWSTKEDCCRLQKLISGCSANRLSSLKM